MLIIEKKITTHCWVCNYCGAEAEEAHVMKGTTCTLCSYVCGDPHIWDWNGGNGKCRLCGAHHESHEYDSRAGRCKVCGEYCAHENVEEQGHEDPVDPDDPDGDKVWVPDPVCLTCGMHLIAPDHGEIECDHVWQDGFCTKCDMSYDHYLYEQNMDPSGEEPDPECDHEWDNGVCAKCGEICDHSWSEATCTAPKTCTNCGMTEGEPIDHKFSAKWSYDDRQHWHECDYHCGTKNALANHDWLAGMCMTCGKECSHDWVDGRCTICGRICRHTWKEATCSAPKTCTACGATEGEADPDAHDWKSDGFTWAADHSGATLHFTCGNNSSHEASPDVTVKKETILPTASADGRIEYTAKASFQDQPYEEVITEQIARGGYENKTGEASWTKGSEESLTFRIARAEYDEFTFQLFTGISVDGAAVDPDQYTSAPGSVMITVPAAYLETLSEGDHTLTAEFEDGSADASFTIEEEEEPEPGNEEPEPGNEEPGSGTEEPGSGNEEPGTNPEGSETEPTVTPTPKPEKEKKNDSKSPVTGDGSVLPVLLACAVMLLLVATRQKRRLGSN